MTLEILMFSIEVLSKNNAAKYMIHSQSGRFKSSDSKIFINLTTTQNSAYNLLLDFSYLASSTFFQLIFFLQKIRPFSFIVSFISSLH